MFACLFLSTALAADSAVLPTELHRFSETSLRLDVRVEGGTVSVRTDAFARSPEVRVVQDEPCAITRGTTSGPSLDIRGCIARVEIVAPRSLAVHLTVDSGDVDLATSTPISVDVARGNVTGRARGSVRVKVGVGSVSLEGLTLKPRVSVVSGTTTLGYAAEG